ncbi:MAG: hypothetical protein OEV74_16420 [Cyclobacteriaceae bacterium]|nr:hypothetical protein [Cyclobacteriaceae bacterium]MDH4297866.1 hypothetical protein [Cyclobacteriaceae bacterium]MDH5250203.1 hypothetical protein [Cyclobacteriaceae bacterium]
MHSKTSYRLTGFTLAMKTLLITPEGLEKIKAELDHLWRVECPTINYLT